MTFQSDPGAIRWKLHLKSSPQAVFEKLSTNDGRASFWAESAGERNGIIHFVFPNQVEWKGRILENIPPQTFQVEYYGGSLTTFELRPEGSGGTHLTLIDRGVPAEDRAEVIAGWVSILMTLKASVDFGVDPRNHDPRRTWDDGFVEN